MASASPAYRAWQTLSDKPGGRWLFSRAIALKAPFFASIGATFVDLRPGYCEIRMPFRRSVTNHIGTVHAIAMCNMAELAGGTMTDASVPDGYRWIPKGMTVDYLKKATTDLRAISQIEQLPEAAGAHELVAPVDVMDTHGDIVFHADIRMWLSPNTRGG